MFPSRINCIVLFLCAATLWLVPAVAAPEKLPPKEAYAGAEKCRECHQEKHDGWKRTFHSTVVQDAKEDPTVILGDFSEPNLGFNKDEVEFAIGGHWNQRYMKKIGDDYFVLPKTWSVASQKWETTNKWTWKRMPYDQYCIGCHATRYDPATETYVEHTIGCEACHGPGAEHAAGGGDIDKIVHPGKLGSVEMELLCASCHVRGTDPSGKYHFPVGYVPGRDLSDYYIAKAKTEDESGRDAFLRLFRKWWTTAGTEGAECAVCGIFGEKAAKEPKTVTEKCMACHSFGDDYSKHTKHKPETVISCLDCHKKIQVDVEPTEDVHSVSYFLVHTRTCYDRNFNKACQKCHQDMDEKVLHRNILSWKQERSIVHDLDDE